MENFAWTQPMKNSMFKKQDAGKIPDKFITKDEMRLNPSKPTPTYRSIYTYIAATQPPTPNYHCKK